MIKKRFLIIYCLVFLSVIISGCNNESAETESEGGTDKTIIQVAYPLGAGTVSDESAKLFKEIVEAEVGDEIEIQLFPDGVLGTDVEVLEGLRVGAQDATIIATPITSIDERFNFFELPYLFESREEVESITQGEIGTELLNGLEEHNLKGLSFWHSGWRHITSNNPIEAPEDLEGLDIRTPSSPARVQLFEELGANPTPLSFGEMFSALQQGVVDGQENPTYVVTQQSLYEVQDYFSMTGHVYTSNYILFSKQLWDSLSEDIQQTLQEAAEEVSDASWGMDEELEEEALNEISEQMEIIEPDTSKFSEATEHMYEDPNLIDQELMEDILETLEDVE